MACSLVFILTWQSQPSQPPILFWQGKAVRTVLSCYQRFEARNSIDWVPGKRSNGSICAWLSCSSCLDYMFVTISAVSQTVYVVSSKRVEVRLFCLGRLGRQDFWCRRPCAPIFFDPSQTSTRSRVDIFRFRSTGCVGMLTFRVTF